MAIILSGETNTIDINGVGVATEAELDITNAELALKAGQTEVETIVEISVPTACILTFPINVVPTSFLECNGAELSRTAYADLFAVIGTTYGVGDGSTTFNIPDLRGEFIRGFDNGRGIDAGRSIGSWQEDAFQGHHHQLYTGYGSNTDQGRVSRIANGNGGWNSAVRNPENDGVNGVPRTASETRPRNIAMMYCIKY